MELGSPTYRELLEQLKTLNDEQLDMNVTVFVSSLDEYMPVQKTLIQQGALEFTDGEKCDVLDDGHPVIII